jgi:hypothetical protein
VICNKCGINESDTHLCQQGDTRLISKYPMQGWNCTPMCQACAEKAISGTFCTYCGHEITARQVTVQASLVQTDAGQWSEESKTITALCPNCGATLGRPSSLNARIVIG